MAMMMMKRVYLVFFPFGSGSPIDLGICALRPRRVERDPSALASYRKKDGDGRTGVDASIRGCARVSLVLEFTLLGSEGREGDQAIFLRFTLPPGEGDIALFGLIARLFPFGSMT